MSERCKNRTLYKSNSPPPGPIFAQQTSFLTPPPYVRHCLLHHCPSLSPPHATTNPIVFTLWPTPSSTIVVGAAAEDADFSVAACEVYVIYLNDREREHTYCLYLTKTVFTCIYFPPQLVADDVYHRLAVMRVREKKRKKDKTNFLRRRPSVHRASSSLTTWVQKCGFSRWNAVTATTVVYKCIIVSARYKSNLRDPKNRVIYFLRTAGHYLTKKSTPASATGRCGVDGFQVVSERQLTAVLNTHTPGPRIFSQGCSKLRTNGSIEIVIRTGVA